MRRYGKISTSLWVSSGKWKAVQSDGAKLLYFYLQTCTHSTPIGTYVLPMAYAEADLQWSQEEILKCMADLQEAELVEYDEAESVVHLYGALKVDPPNNQNHAKGMVATIKALPNCRCKQLCIDEFKSLTVSEPFRDRFERVSIPIPNPIETTGKERRGTGKGTGVVVPAGETSADSPPTDPPSSDDGGTSPATDKEAKDGTDTTATMHIGQRVNELWRELGLGASRGYDWNQGAVRITTLTADFTDEEILEGVRKIARTPGLAWAGKRGPAYLATRNPEGTWRLEIVLTWEEKHEPELVTTTHPPAWRPT